MLFRSQIDSPSTVQAQQRRQPCRRKTPAHPVRRRVQPSRRLRWVADRVQSPSLVVEEVEVEAVLVGAVQVEVDVVEPPVATSLNPKGAREKMTQSTGRRIPVQRTGN